MNKPTRTRVMVFCASGDLQNIMINTLCRDHDVVGVVLVQAASRTQTALHKLKNLCTYLYPPNGYRYLMARLKLPRFERAANRRLEALYPNFKEWQTLPVGLNSIQVDNINQAKVIEFVESLAPDIICVNGTNLIREPLLSKGVTLPYGMINLHTGLSPYSRGGNCNLFMLLEGKPELVGGTIHYIDKGIDSGDIIATFRPAMHKDEPFEMIDARVFLEGFEQLSKAISGVADGGMPTVEQWETGKLFLQRTGYHYQPYCRLQVNEMIRDGLLEDYLANQNERDRGIQLINPS